MLAHHIKRLFWLLCLVAALGAGLPATHTAAQPDTLDKLVLVGPPGPLSIPLAYLVANDKLSDVADEVELVLWEDQNQLRALVAGNDADFITMPSNNAAIFYNNDLDVQLLDIAVWNAAFGVSADTSITTLADAEGMRVVIPFEGSVPDLIFQHVAAANGLDPRTNFAVQYTTNPQQAAQMIIAGQADLAILPEPLATSVVLNTKESDTPLTRVFALSDDWAAAMDGTDTDAINTPIAGTVALPRIQDRPDVIDAFLREYALAVEWTIENPQEAGQMAEEELPDLGFKAGPTAQSLQNVLWQDMPAAEAREDVEAFFTALMDLSSDVIGGDLPDDGFYYVPESGENGS
jgi:NitT/TauT family transport system substrate-binding protein